MAPVKENRAPRAFNLVTPLKVSGATFSGGAGENGAAGVNRIPLPWHKRGARQRPALHPPHGRREEPAPEGAASLSFCP